MIGFLLVGLALLAVVAKLHFWLGRRQFERRNSAGVEEFEGYNAMVKTKIKEGLVFAGAVIVGLAGVTCIFIYALALTK